MRLANVGLLNYCHDAIQGRLEWADSSRYTYGCVSNAPNRCLCANCRDALLHVCRIHRILSQPRGNALLVGVGGSGRKSLARLAAYIGELKVFSIEITNTYRLMEFREDLKGLYRQTGVAGKPTMFLFDESQVSWGQTAAVHYKYEAFQ